MSDEQLKHAAVDDRGWTALLYALGEMTVAEQEAFEQRLMTDGALCDELVSVVRTCSVVAEVDRLAAGSARHASRVSVAQLNSASRSSGTAPRRTAAIIVAVSCAMLLMVATVLNVSPPMPDSIVLNEDETDVFVKLLADDAERLVVVDDSEESGVDESVNELLAPEWLLAAIELDETPTGNDDTRTDPDEDIELF